MINVIIVEDNIDDASALKNCINQYGEEYHKQFIINHYDDGNVFLNNYTGTDILFLDIMLPGVDGMTIAEKIREKDDNVIIVFVTNMLQMAIKGYSVRAFDFVIKPISYNAFKLRFTDILKLIEKNQGKELWISNKNGKVKINSSRILYVEIIQHILIYHTLDGEYKSTGTLLHLQEILKDEPFSMCNRCYFVNLSFVTSVVNQDVIVEDKYLPISRTKRKSFLKDLNDYIAMYGRGK